MQTVLLVQSPSGLAGGLEWRDWLNFAAFGLGIIGFAFTIWQLVRTRRAAEAAQQAVENAQQSLVRNYLLILVPQLQRIEQDLDNAVDNDEVKSTLSHLATWRWQAGQLQGLLLQNRTNDKDLLVALQDSVTLASEAKGSLLDGTRPVLKATKKARTAIAVVTNQTGALLAQLSAQVGSEDT